MAGPFYVDGAVGNDGNAGTSEGAGNAWLTIQKALDTVAANEKVWVKASATYNEALTTTTPGGAATPIVFEGYTSSTGDEGIAMNDGTAGALVNGWTPISGVNYYVWKNFQFTCFSGIAFGSTTGDSIMAYRIQALSSGLGILVDDHCTILSCNAGSNTGDGILVGSFAAVVQSTSRNNGGSGIESTGGMSLNGCLVRNNTGHGINMTGTTSYVILVNNTVQAAAASGNTGIYINAANATHKIICTNNTVSGYSGGGGIGIETAVMGERTFLFNNNVFGCETGYSGCSDLGGGTTSDPSFVSATDYTPTSGSPLIAAGRDVTDVPNAYTTTAQAATVGALLRATVSAGGGLLAPNKRGNMQ